ncbi:MAG: S41 family peptidase, partial [Caldilineaceae bacterium]|nr:S41 family peptidase [Caldilineaceae bacterium]
LTYGAIRGMVDALGDTGHSAFLTPEQRKEQQSDLSGTFTGIGAQMGVKDGLPIIVAPLDGSPAEKAGLKAGDIIMKVDGEDVSALSLSEIVTKVRGPNNTQVTLTILRPKDEKSLDITITRGEITSPTATWSMIPDSKVALIRLSQFGENATDQMVQALNAAKAAGATSLIVDVRSNPGGLLQQAISVTSQFLSDGNVMMEEDAEGNRTPFPVEPGGVATDLPLVVLINAGSASSSEIFAGAIQDHQRGQLVGETTFGTGTVLQPFNLSDGSEIMLGTKQWLTSNGRLIRKQGIQPDVEVKLPLGTDLITPATAKNMTLDEIKSSEDTQMIKALELLKVLPETGN